MFRKSKIIPVKKILDDFLITDDGCYHVGKFLSLSINKYKYYVNDCFHMRSRSGLINPLYKLSLFNDFGNMLYVIDNIPSQPRPLEIVDEFDKPINIRDVVKLQNSIYIISSEFMMYRYKWHYERSYTSVKCYGIESLDKSYMNGNPIKVKNGNITKSSNMFTITSGSEVSIFLMNKMFVYYADFQIEKTFVFDNNTVLITGKSNIFLSFDDMNTMINMKVSKFPDMKTSHISQAIYANNRFCENGYLILMDDGMIEFWYLHDNKIEKINPKTPEAISVMSELENGTRFKQIYYDDDNLYTVAVRQHASDVGIVWDPSNSMALNQIHHKRVLEFPVKKFIITRGHKYAISYDDSIWHSPEESLSFEKTQFKLCQDLNFSSKMPDMEFMFE